MFLLSCVFLSFRLVTYLCWGVVLNGGRYRVVETKITGTLERGFESVVSLKFSIVHSQMEK